MFGSEKAMAASIEGVKNGLDALIYTDEEKSHDAAAERAQARQMIVGWMDKTQGQNIARRFLAMMIAGTWLFQYFASMALNLAAVWSDNPKLGESAAVIGANAESMTGAMMLILGFYFAAPHLGKIAEGAIAKFAGR